MNIDKIIEESLRNLFWSLILLASGIELTHRVDSEALVIIGIIFIGIAAVEIIINTIIVPIIKTRS